MMYLENRNESHRVNWEYLYLVIIWGHFFFHCQAPNTKHQTHMEIIGNFSFQAFQVFVLGRYCVSSGHQSLNDQSFPSAV